MHPQPTVSAGGLFRLRFLAEIWQGRWLSLGCGVSGAGVRSFRDRLTIGALIMFIGSIMLIGGLFMADPTSPAKPVDHPRQKRSEPSVIAPPFTNALANESSPYLIQHAHNPVDWHAWGPEAFAEARQSGKPIFLSVGYSTCYWCHVMERQVFENPQLAALMNKHFVNIKVDREERPDVDDIYMAAVQLMTGHGGWPMSVFLTPPGSDGEDDPGLKPFWAGTYIPPQPRHGMPGFGQVVEGLAHAWKTQRRDVIEQANRVAQAIRDHLDQQDHPTRLEAKVVQDAANGLMTMFDQTHGGFGQAPKFPQPTNLMFLLKVYQNNPNSDLWNVLSYTLERMAHGGMYDQIGGGFHRYATDERWLVPHFEKMLYDNAQLVEVYLTAHTIQPDTKDPRLYERVVRETCDYVLRQMTDPTGPFWSAQDAEVDAREGGSYLWTPVQVRAAVGEALGDLAIKMYGLDKGTNFQDPHDHEQPPSNVLFLPLRLDELAQQESLSLDQLYDARAHINQAMLGARNQRKQPATDDKVLVAWNGLMIAALARGGAALDQPTYTQAAAKAAAYILEHMRQPPTSDAGPPGLYRTMRGDRAKIPAFLEDYASLSQGLIQLHRATGHERWLQAARELTGIARQRFSAAANRGGGYYDTLANQSDLFVRTVSTYDGAIPTGNSQMIHNLIDLYQLTGKPEYLDQAVVDLQAFGGSLTQRPAAMVHMHHALLRVLEIDAGRLAAMPDTDTAPSRSTQPIQVTAHPQTVALSSGAARVRVTVSIAKGYHLNAHGTGVAGVIPTTLELTGGDHLELHTEYPQAVKRKYPLAQEPLEVYEGTVVIDATIRTGDRQTSARQSAATAQPRLVLRYQACTQSSCLQPQTLDVPVVIEYRPLP